jgi:molybdate transport system substrate-binding protein
MSDTGLGAIRLLSTLALMGAMDELSRRYQAASGTRIEADFAPTVALLARIRGGEAADITILTEQGIEELISEGLILPGRTDIALSFIGIAVRAGAPKPDITSVSACRAALLAASSVAYSRIGASGIFFAGLIERLGITEAVNARARIVSSGFTAEPVARGEAALAVQQMSELMVVPGVDLVGRLPAEIQCAATFSAGVLRGGEGSGRARGLLRFLTSPEATPILRRAGLEPPEAR